MKILLIEDEKKVASFIHQGLSESEYEVEVAHDGDTGLEKATGQDYDMFIIDWLLPGISGVEICRRIRQEKPHVPILMLTAKDTISDKVEGLESGADDYLTKPFAFEELKARIKALLRRKELGGAVEQILTIDDLEVDVISRKVFRGGKEILLSNREFDMLVYFLKNKNKIITRKDLAKAVWNIDFNTGTNFVEVYINYLRKKLDTGSGKPLILTIRGAGYIMREEGDENN
ncbi:MAG: DNA-binding response regulator [Calditrichaeota bacterium]|nr:MAG: DNA-binding response regulator [Calditrichota bacterium]